ncbi:DUF2971 domain-containing protein [Mucilaginibacter pedocola]|uniref:DUF2971 domain-containing protein n=1 Tax=Mucilaginibacter pedocola TaxID=1792845 RepID=A0A1S9PLR8_9SPHI|nr:DUF2971 domain-containing protein [Mucilaginibacter pedocola]OOQ61910.1 hypothetical protein BC343_02280 [Mucilaginibacter pedocola]
MKNTSRTRKIKRLNRFTTLPVLLDLLQRKKLTLLNPKLWDDKNDSEVILAYKEKKNIKNLFAVCLSHGDETIHHWKTFSDGTSGCLIEFNAEKLFEIIDKVDNLKHGKVIYRKLSDVEKADSPIDVDKMPFTKRWPYRCEEEYRIIVESNTDETFFEIDIPLDVIKRITISQHMPEPIYATLKNHLKGLRGDPKSRINRSTLYENKRWINRFKTD